MADTALSDAVAHFARLMAGLPDVALERDWQWRAHDEGVRFAFFVTYQELRDLAVTIAGGRATHGDTLTARQILALHQAAYRDLHGVLAGVDDDLLDRAPAEGEWPLRAVLEHIVGPEHSFFARIRYAVDQRRAGVSAPTPLPREQIVAYHPIITFDGPLAQILARYDELHAKVVEQFAALDDDLAALSLWWEGYPVPARFRLHRFDAHLRQHTIQVEKTLDALGHTPTEARRLNRLLYSALAGVESATFGAQDSDRNSYVAERQALAATIAGRAGEIARAVA